MFITKRTLSRRTVLRGMGAVVALPFLDAMVPAQALGNEIEAIRPKSHRVRNVEQLVVAGR
jgi:hypothetical protein